MSAAERGYIIFMTVNSEHRVRRDMIQVTQWRK